MVETIHIWTTDKIYCHRLKSIVDLTQAHVEENCLTCRYFSGTAQGQGIENTYYDGSNEAILSNPNPWALRDKMLQVSDREVDMAFEEERKRRLTIRSVVIDQEEANRKLMEEIGA